MITIDEDLGIDYADIPPWRSYHLNATGSTVEELLEDATISEIDQDGGEMDCYGLKDHCLSPFGQRIELGEPVAIEAAIKLIKERNNG